MWGTTLPLPPLETTHTTPHGAALTDKQLGSFVRQAIAAKHCNPSGINSQLCWRPQPEPLPNTSHEPTLPPPSRNKDLPSRTHKPPGG